MMDQRRSCDGDQAPAAAGDLPKLVQHLTPSDEIQPPRNPSRTSAKKYFVEI
jgi:hypothetical protein